jgi:hypothetical protein
MATPRVQIIEALEAENWEGAIKLAKQTAKEEGYAANYAVQVAATAKNIEALETTNTKLTELNKNIEKMDKQANRLTWVTIFLTFVSLVIAYNQYQLELGRQRPELAPFGSQICLPTLNFGIQTWNTEEKRIIFQVWNIGETKAQVEVKIFGHGINFVDSPKSASLGENYSYSGFIVPTQALPSGYSSSPPWVFADYKLNGKNNSPPSSFSFDYSVRCVNNCKKEIIYQGTCKYNKASETPELSYTLVD